MDYDHRIILVALLVLVINTSSFGQAITSISGTVINSKNEALMGNALLISVKDSTILKGTSFLEGKFELTNLNATNVLLKLTSLEFQDTYITINYNGERNINLGTIPVNKAINQLDEVVLVSNIPLFQTKPDGSVQVNVENTVLSASNSVAEILSRSPNVLVADEGISIFGKGEAIIYLNGQRILDEQLSNIQTSEIKSIEIISNPSAKYDAEGQAIINIITLKNAFEGIKGLVSQNITVSDFAPPGANTNLSLDYRKQKVSITGNYGLQQGVQRFILNTTRNRSQEADFFNSTITTDWERKRKYFANYGLGVQYNWTENSYFSIAYNGLTNDLGGTETSNNTITFNEETENFKSILDKDDLTTQHALVLNFLKALDTIGSSLYFGSQFSLYNTNINDIINEQSVRGGQTSNRSLKNIVTREIPILSAQLDYVKAFSAKSQIELGIKFGRVNNSSNSQFLISSNDDGFIFDENLSNGFEYNEYIYGAYISYKKSIPDKFNYSIGLRNEYTTYDLSTGNTSQESLKKNYFNLFPNLSISTSLGENKSLFASYSARIDRPRYQSLNPTIVYQDAFTSIQGNPNIIPEKIHAFEIGTNLEKVTLKLGYNYTIDPITGGAVQGEDPKSYVLQRLNSKAGHDFFGSITLPIDVGWWSSMNTLTVSYNKLIDTQSSFGFKETRPQAYFYSNNKFTLFKSLKLQVLGWYLSNRYDGIYFRKNQAVITLGLEKDFFKKSLKLQLVANDIFHTNKPDGNYQLGETLIFFDRIYNTQYFRFVATYNFGKLKKSNYNRKSSGEEENGRF